MNLDNNDNDNDDMTERSRVSSGGTTTSSILSNLFHSSFWSSSILPPDGDEEDSSKVSVDSQDDGKEQEQDDVCLEGTLLHKVNSNGPWKRRYVVLHFHHQGSLECFKFSKKEVPTRLAKRKLYTQLHHHPRGTASPDSSLSSPTATTTTTHEVAKQQQIWHLSSDQPWRVMDIEKSSNFRVEMNHPNVEDDGANSSFSSSSIGIEEVKSHDTSTSASSVGSSSSYYFQCPHGLEEKTLWLQAFDKMNRLVQSKQEKQHQFHKLSSLSQTLSQHTVGRLRNTTSTGFKLRYESLKLAQQDELFLNNNKTTLNGASITAAAASSSSSPHHHSSSLAQREAELLSRKDKNLDNTYKVVPSYAYPNMRMNRTQLRKEMLLPSSHFYDLRVSKTDDNNNEIGTLRVEVLQCLGLPKLDSIGESDPVVYMVCGSYAFCTDVIPECGNPMWLRKMRRACIFPIHHAYARLYVGVLDDDGKKEKDDYCGRVVLDLARLRPNCTYDVTLPLRLSAHVYSRRQRGSIRLRFHLDYTKGGERAAMLSYLPKSLRMPSSRGKREADVTVLCSDEKAFQNVAVTVHGAHMPGRFSAKQLKATIREINFTRIMVVRYVIMKQIKDTMAWRNPTISLFVFSAWMQCVYANSVALVPGHVVTFLLLHLWRNYAIYGIDVPAQRGFLPPTWEEMMLALWKGDANSDSQCIAPLDMKTGRRSSANTDEMVPAFAPHHKSTSIMSDTTTSLEVIAEAFKKGVKVRDRRFYFKKYTHVFMGTQAVSFLVNSNFAKSRKDAVRIGRALSRELHLFEHVMNAHEFKDERLFYRFVCADETDYILETHDPRGKTVFRALGFLEDHHDESYNYDNDHLEFPYANGAEYPKFTVKESLVNRLTKSPKAGGERRKSAIVEEQEQEEAELQVTGVNSSPTNDSNASLSFNEMGEDTNAVHDTDLDVSDHMYDTDHFQSIRSDDEVDTTGEGSGADQDYVMVEVRPKRPPPPQNMDFRAKKDKDITDVLQDVKEKMHELTFQLFNDRVYDLDTDNKTNNTDEKPSRTKKKQLDKLLNTGQYSHPNPGVSKIGLYLEPIIGMILPFLCVFRALFNIFTWRDPIISFWISVFAPMVIVILHFFPWRCAMLVLGAVAVGPQNWILRVYRERKERQSPDDGAATTPKFVKRPRAIERDSKEQPVFSSHLCTHRGETKQKTRSKDDSNVYRVAVPYNALMYQRFYDWPPEPQYARVVADVDSTSPVNKAALCDSLPASASTDTMESTIERAAGKKRGFSRIRRRFRGRGSSKD